MASGATEFWVRVAAGLEYGSSYTLSCDYWETIALYHNELPGWPNLNVVMAGKT